MNENLSQLCTILTAKPFDLAKEKNMLGRSRPSDMVTGDLRCSDSAIALATSGGADADKAINGTLVNALKPPMLEKEVLNSEPLDMKCLCKQQGYSIYYNLPFWNAVSLINCNQG